MMSQLEKLMSIILVVNPGFNNKIRDIESKIPSITGLATTTALTAVKSAIPAIGDICNKIKIDNLYITLTDDNKFTKDILDEKIKK